MERKIDKMMRSEIVSNSDPELLLLGKPESNVITTESEMPFLYQEKERDKTARDREAISDPLTCQRLGPKSKFSHRKLSKIKRASSFARPLAQAT
jgi:hypothetical protein